MSAPAPQAGDQDVTFKYPALDQPGNQIRLLKIEFLDNTEDDFARNEIICSMTVHDLSDPDLHYTAISYTWGDAKPTKHIYINGARVAVWPNCWYALWQVKNNARPTSTITSREAVVNHTYWLDAVCINQDDVGEKNVQVAAMGRIYSQADSVAACIGFESHDSLLFDERHAWQWSQQTEKQKEESREVMSELYKELMKRPWWHRVWTVQEAMLAKDILVFCGNRCIRWRMLRVQLRWAERNYSHPQQYGQLDNFFRDIGNSQSPRGRLVLPLAVLIERYSSRRCAKVHDKLYGLLSMSSTMEQSRLSIDYDRPLLEVLFDFIDALAEHQIHNGMAEERSGHQKVALRPYRAVRRLADELFKAGKGFYDILVRFWFWRIGRRATDDSMMKIKSSFLAFEDDTIIAHCHQINASCDKIRMFAGGNWLKRERLQQGLKKQCLYSVSDPVEYLWGQAPDVILETLEDTRWKSAVTSALVTVNCSDDAEYPGEVRFLCPTSTLDGD